jgi:hypothetical protein
MRSELNWDTHVDLVTIFLSNSKHLLSNEKAFPQHQQY